MRKAKPWIGGLCAFFFVQWAGASEVYSWVDDNGVMHFGDRAPADEEVVQVTVPQPNLAEARPVEPKRSIRQGPSRRRPLRSAPDDHGDRYAEKCHKARQQLRLIRAKRRAGYRGSEERALDARQRRYRADERFYCGD